MFFQFFRRGAEEAPARTRVGTGATYTYRLHHRFENVERSVVVQHAPRPLISIVAFDAIGGAEARGRRPGARVARRAQTRSRQAQLSVRAVEDANLADVPLTAAAAAARLRQRQLTRSRAAVAPEPPV